MVVIMNTKLEQDENEKWLGMGNQELLDSFSSYAAMKARHSYGPQGHRGMSVLIFESSAMGFLEAERLHNHFQEQGKDRDAWDRGAVRFCPGGKRQLYGYMAQKQDLDHFNRHCNESSMILSEGLRHTDKGNRSLRQRSKTQHEQHKEEMDSQEQFFIDQLEAIEMIQEERKKEKAHVSAGRDRRQREEEFEKFTKSQQKEMEKYVSEKEKLEQTYEDKKISIRQRRFEEDVQLEKDFNEALNQLMDKYMPHRYAEEGSSSSQ
ncbi:hypothetical protein Vadar_018895 [Vaccinium darrowii]|uniref:Uncharacterized protein n=1 Tax=Vaccinium darrowii TaxID=229202 RepID=A0ACB7ZK14_9ERIC|nr:hypothetical protein Vadar_018895 [Vaccinium darrowii]